MYYAITAEFHGGGGVPPWKLYKKKGVGRQAEATLETLWEHTQWPNDETISSMWDLHKVRRDQVIEWFQEKRRVARSGGRSGRGGPGRGVTEQTEDGTDWDAEWDVPVIDEIGEEVTIDAANDQQWGIAHE